MIVRAVNLGGTNCKSQWNCQVPNLYLLLIRIYIDYKSLNLLDFKLITRQDRRTSIQRMIQRFCTWVPGQLVVTLEEQDQVLMKYNELRFEFSEARILWLPIQRGHMDNEHLYKFILAIQYVKGCAYKLNIETNTISI